MRYEAKPWPGELKPREGHGETFWCVYQGAIPRFSRTMSEAEAKAITWMLNCVANGDTIVATFDGGSDTYDGPPL